LKLFFVFILLYLLILFLTFISEVTYKKRTIPEVRNDIKKIIMKTSILYLVFIAATIFYQLIGIEFNEQ
jgi:Na+-transporting methylmalonyl-CoA/oxaloacetate decarboxylase gamma subunit